MSQENVEIVRRFLRLAPENPDAAWDIFDSDVEWEIGDLGLPDFPRSSRGPDGVREFFRRWVGAFGNCGFEVEEVIDGGDAVLVHIHQWGSGKGSGATVEGRFWEVWMIRDGKAVRVVHHSEKADALEAAGLSE
jgi:ketosteroid isomerase-like protein